MRTSLTGPGPEGRDLILSGQFRGADRDLVPPGTFHGDDRDLIPAGTFH